MGERYWYLVVFQQGKRTEKRVPRTKHNTQVLTQYVKDVQAKDNGMKAHLVGRIETSLYPRGDIREHRQNGEMWCPYCRTWRFFTVPKYHPRAEFGTEPWFDNTNYRQGIKRCNWCHVNELDWWICNANGTFAEARASKRRKRGRKKRVRR